MRGYTVHAGIRLVFIVVQYIAAYLDIRGVTLVRLDLDDGLWLRLRHRHETAAVHDQDRLCFNPVYRALRLDHRAGHRGNGRPGDPASGPDRPG